MTQDIRMMPNFRMVIDMKYGIEASDLETTKQLNDEVKCTIATSKKGIIVKAIQGIRRGEEVGLFGSPDNTPLKLKSLEHLNPPVKDLILQRYPIAEKGGIFQHPNDDIKLITFVTHSKTPNVNSNTGKAIKYIHVGDEITI